MGFYESKWLNEYNLNKPKFYLKFADIILAAFEKEQDSLNFLNFLNKRHPNIKFTIDHYDKPIDHSLLSLMYSFQASINISQTDLYRISLNF